MSVSFPRHFLLGKISFKLVILLGMLSLCTGCTSVLSPMTGVPASQLSPQLRGVPRNNLVPVPLSLLRQPPVEQYRLGAGDILGLYIQGILPPRGVDQEIEEAPPVHFPEEGSDLPPSVGFPIPVRDDGTLALPLIRPINVKNMTLMEAEEAIREAYTIDRQILKVGKDRILVSLMKERTVRVIVVREDASVQNNGGNSTLGPDRVGEGFTLDLPAYKNDLMHALAETGGLPGVTAKNEVKILKANRLPQGGGMIDASFMQGLPMAGGGCSICGTVGLGSCSCNDSCECNNNLYDDPTAVRIPLRVQPGQMPQFDPRDIVLDDGDIVVIEARDTEVFYTGGLLPGGEHLLPRDYDLDVFGAMAMAGQSVGGSAGNRGGGGGAAGLIGNFGGANPSQLFIMRKDECGQQFNISVDLALALQNPNERILVQPGDTLILRYKPCEEAVNFGLVAFFTFGIQQLFD